MLIDYGLSIKTGRIYRQSQYNIQPLFQVQIYIIIKYKTKIQDRNHIFLLNHESNRINIQGIFVALRF